MKAVIVFITVLFFLFFANPVFAATQLSVDSVPLTIDQLQEFDVNVNFSCPGCSTDSYLRGVFYPSGSSYFGYTQDNSGNWSNFPGGNCLTYFKIAKTDLTSEGSWSGKLKFKPDISNSYYSGPGEYLFKVGRYTPSCSSPSVWSQETTIAITGPSPTPTPTSTPTPGPTNTPTPTPTSTPTPTPTRSPTQGSTIIPTSIPTSKQSVDPGSEQPVSASVLGDNMVNQPTVSPLSDLLSNGKDTLPPDPTKKPDTVFQMVSMGLGIIFIVICAILTFRIIKKGEIIKNEDG
jgi:hypothetical protein